MTVTNERSQAKAYGARLAEWVARIERRVPPDAAPPALSMAWLLRLRWAAVVGQATTVLVVYAVLDVPVSAATLLALVGVTAVSNFILCRRAADEGAGLRSRFERMLTLDTFTLTALLLLSGGADNPFSSFYLVHVAMAAVALGQRAAWRMVALSAGCLLGLYLASRFSTRLLSVPHDLHLAGMLVSAVLAAAAIAFFAGHLHRALQRREAEVARLRVAAEKSERFAALATLAAGVAHELGSPLGTILLAARELERSVAALGDEETAADVRLIANETERCRVLLGRLNARSTAELGEAPVMCHTAEIFADVRRLLSPPLAARLHTAEPPDAELFLPRAAVVEAVASLVRNAGDTADGVVELAGEISGPVVRFQVRDCGPPLPPEVAAHLGEPFFTTKQPGRGMGLGLYLVRLLAERLGGSFTLTRHGAETVATLTLPVRAPLSTT
jgi:two-component system sensor histidine kinase RegB